MRRRPLGTTGLEVTPIGLGLAALGRPAYIDVGRAEDLGVDRGLDAMRQRTHEVLDAAYEVGIRYVDAARSYGEAERFLASWLAAHPDSAAGVTVGSKWGYTYVAAWRLDADVHEVKDHSAAALRRQATESLAHLGRHLRLYQIHSATLETGVLDDHVVLEELRRLADEHGLAIGMSVSGPRQAEVIHRALELDEPNPFRCVQATWNVLERSAGDALAAAHDAGWGVLVKEALANGRLTGRGAPPITAVLGRVAARHGIGEDAIALAAVLANPWADVALSGAVTPAQVRSNASGVDVELSREDLAELGALAVPSEAYWSARSALAWT